MTMTSFMCEPMETAQSLGDDPHAVGPRPQGSVRAQATQRCGPLSPCVGGSMGHRQVLE